MSPYYEKNRERILARNKAWNAANKDKTRATYMRYHRADRVRAMLKSAKARSVKKGIPFTITEVDVVVPEICPIMDVPLNRNTTKEDKRFAPSLDRIDNTKGYEPGNVRVISWIANMMKRDATEEELVMFCEGVLREVFER